MPNQRMPRRKLFLGIGGAFVMVLLAVGIVLYPKAKQQWSTPLGPGLELPTQTPTESQPTGTAIALAVDTEQVTPTKAQASTAAPPTQTFTPASSPTATPKPLCGGPPVMTILGVGADSGYDYRYGLADVIRIARVDFVTPKVTVLSMPRDLWVEIPDINQEHNIDHGKLNQAYFYGGPGMGYYDGPGAGPGLLARTLDLNFGLRVDHYGAVNMQTFAKIVDAVGGIDLYLPQDVDGRPIDDKTIDLGYFTAGQHHFNGEEALRLARIRKKYNDFTRMDNQNMVLCALKEKVLTASVLPKIPKIVASFQDSVLTDLSPQQIGQMACLLPKIERQNLIFTSLPQDVLEPSRVYNPTIKNETYILDVDNQVVRDYVARFMAGDWPTEPKEPTCP